MRSIGPCCYSTFMLQIYTGRIAGEMKMSFSIWRKKCWLVYFVFLIPLFVSKCLLWNLKGGFTTEYFCFSARISCCYHYAKANILILAFENLTYILNVSVKLSISLVKVMQVSFLDCMSKVGEKLLKEEIVITRFAKCANV